MRKKVKKGSDQEGEEAEETGSDRSISGRESHPSRSKLRVLRKRSRAHENKVSQDLKLVSDTKDKNSDFLQKDKKVIVPSQSTDVPSMSMPKTEIFKQADMPPNTPTADLKGVPLDWSKVDRSKMMAYKLVPMPVEEMATLPGECLRLHHIY